MDRLACANLPAFPLQLLLKRHPDWKGHPAAAVAEDKPQGLILWVNEKARQAGVLPGLRYAAGFSLAAGLRAGAIAPAEIEQAVAALTERLMRFTPDVEPCAEEPGVFWLSGAGLKLLYPSLKQWADSVHADIAAQGFHATVVVGFSRFGSYALAKAGKGTAVLGDLAEERKRAEKVPLGRLDFYPGLRDALFKLGIDTVGAFLSLPPGGLYERFGPRAYRLHRLASGDLWAPLMPCVPEEAVARKHLLDDPESDATRLLFLVKRLLDPILATLAARAQALAGLELSLLVERSGRLQERIRPAAPTLDAAQLLDLIRLRMESMKFFAGVVEIELTTEGCAATREQLRLFNERPRRDLDAANRALARLRAEFGDAAVVRAKLTDGHLPEARFTWEPLRRVALPRNDLNDLNVLNGSKEFSGVLVRRILAKPMQLPSGPHHTTHEDGWLILGPKYGSVEKLSGPYVFSGGWWNREIHREYYFAETRRGDILWVYYDRMRRRWYLQGAVE